MVGPEQPLVDGLHDALRKVGVYCFGPSQRAARLEGSKAYMKDFAARYSIPTAEYKVRRRCARPPFRGRTISLAAIGGAASMLSLRCSGATTRPPRTSRRRPSAS